MTVYNMGKRCRIRSFLLLFCILGFFFFRAPTIENSDELELSRTATFVPHKIRATATNTGAWQLPEGYEYYFDERLAHAMVTYFKQKEKFWSKPSVIEFGSGTGKYIKYFLKKQINVRGYDGVDDIYERTGGMVNHIELTVKNELGEADYVVCLEVAEHIPKDFEQIFLENLVSHSKKAVILSWAPPEQSGVGHVNTKKKEDVVRLMQARGYELDESNSKIVRDAATLPWIKKNLMIFLKTRPKQIQVSKV